MDKDGFYGNVEYPRIRGFPGDQLDIDMEEPTLANELRDDNSFQPAELHELDAAIDAQDITHVLFNNLDSGDRADIPFLMDESDTIDVEEDSGYSSGNNNSVDEES